MNIPILRAAIVARIAIRTKKNGVIIFPANVTLSEYITGIFINIPVINVISPKIIGLKALLC